MDWEQLIRELGEQLAMLRRFVLTDGIPLLNEIGTTVGRVAQAVDAAIDEAVEDTLADA